MEAGNGLNQQSDVKIRQLGLELAEGPARVAQDIRVPGGAVGGGGDVIHHPPEVLPVYQIGLPVRGVMKMEAALLGLLGPDVLGHQVDVVHQADGIAEGIGIHVLNQEGLFGAVFLAENHLVGAVDNANLNGLKAQIGTGKPEGGTDLFQFLIHFAILFLKAFRETAVRWRLWRRPARPAFCCCRSPCLPRHR